MASNSPAPATAALSNIISPQFYPVYWDIQDGLHTYYDLYGGRGSTKSSFISVMIVLGIMQDINANAIVFRKVASTVSTSVYEQCLWAIEMLGVQGLWKCTQNPHRMVYVPTGQVIIFRGLDKSKKIKSLKVARGYSKYVWFEELDEFSAKSQNKACAARANGEFKREIVPVEVKKKKETIIFDTDEGPREGSSPEVLARLRPINPGGFVTAGNASGINDGAAAIVVMSEEKAKELGVKPMATFVAGALAGVDPSIMGIGPVAATRKVMAKTGYKIEDFDVIEANEAFAAQSVAVGKDLGIDVDKQLNPRGGAIALGHPVGASGARILVTLLHEMEDKDLKKGLATLCIGGGMGCATIVERD